MRIIESVPIQDVLAHQRPKRPDYPPAGIALETLSDPHWSELSAYLVALKQAGAPDIFPSMWSLRVAKGIRDIVSNCWVEAWVPVP
jgi:hypothetical protein